MAHDNGPSTPSGSQVPDHITRSAPGSADATPKPRSLHPSASSSPSQQLPSRPTNESLPKSLLPAAELYESTPKLKSSESTLLQAFYEPLHSLDMAADFKPGSDGDSSARVGQTIPPEYWVPININHYLVIANAHLSKNSVKQALSARHTPTLEPTFRVRREADIVTYSSTHLTYAVSHALGATLAQPVEVTNEYQYSNLARVDRVWRSWGATTGSFAMLEIKNYGIIDAEEFQRAMYREPGVKNSTLFANLSILSIIKQITNYVQIPTYGTRYASLYDGKYLFLGVFETPPQPTDRPILKGTLVPCTGAENTQARRALLGWLIEAWEKKQRGENENIAETQRPPRPPRKP
ncbi:predicted protein [Chaetomium globosum CBS 148.51]|uniref:Uncharacterized protein n=1 Tax=Chaetomium globosum (strain ATCC 6205 / CBS 148.51 / DSM 1962 / NBRC 6347 / NRRL 1970) TaxID=306901 RepID=Q2GN88_CHAGB|nr:uncharacterized protein CHGG_10566 [Chaetomium globosum CBS 148.51]EAQ84162.1 predicted protein [Chaetomium globosum CBS 148.51]